MSCRFRHEFITPIRFVFGAVACGAIYFGSIYGWEIKIVDVANSTPPDSQSGPQSESQLGEVPRTLPKKKAQPVEAASTSLPSAAPQSVPTVTPSKDLTSSETSILPPLEAPVTEIPASVPQQAQPHVQMTTLDLEWEAVDEASGYEVKLTPKIANEEVGPGQSLSSGPPREPLRFTTTESRLSESVPAGVYRLQIRSKDKKTGYFGPWSKPAEIEAVAKAIELLLPADNSVIKDAKSKRANVMFQWNAVPQALYYTLKVWSEDSSKTQEFIVRAPSKRLNLIAAKVYYWEVTFKTKQAIGYMTKPQRFTFTLLGPQLVQPIVDRNIGLPHVVKARWSASAGAQNYTTKILRHALDEDDWQEYREGKGIEKNSWNFDRLPPGVYRIEVTAHAKNRVDSEPGFYEFTVKPTEDELAKALKSTDVTM
jgi:hypothetical protein